MAAADLQITRVSWRQAPRMFHHATAWANCGSVARARCSIAAARRRRASPPPIHARAVGAGLPPGCAHLFRRSGATSDIGDVVDPFGAEFRRQYARRRTGGGNEQRNGIASVEQIELGFNMRIDRRLPPMASSSVSPRHRAYDPDLFLHVSEMPPVLCSWTHVMSPLYLPERDPTWKS